MKKCTTILVVNMMLYLFYYIVRKIIENCHKKRQFKKPENQENSVITESEARCNQMDFLKIRAGTCFAAITLVLGVLALRAYLSRSANRNLTAAESRNLNADCNVLDFYGKYHTGAYQNKFLLIANIFGRRM